MNNVQTQLEHILLRPDSYVGSVEPETESLWVFNDDTGRMEQREGIGMGTGMGIEIRWRWGNGDSMGMGTGRMKQKHKVWL